MHAATGCPPRIGYELLRNQWWSPTFGKVNVRNTCPTFYWSSRYSQGSTTPPTMHVTQLPIQHAMIDTTKEIKFKKKKLPMCYVSIIKTFGTTLHQCCCLKLKGFLNIIFFYLLSQN